jgi:hypothetical protein
LVASSLLWLEVVVVAASVAAVSRKWEDKV